MGHSHFDNTGTSELLLIGYLRMVLRRGRKRREVVVLLDVGVSKLFWSLGTFLNGFNLTLALDFNLIWVFIVLLNSVVEILSFIPCGSFRVYLLGIEVFLVGWSACSVSCGHISWFYIRFFLLDLLIIEVGWRLLLLLVHALNIFIARRQS